MSEQSKLEQELFSAKWVVQSGNQIGKTAHCLRRIIDAWLASKAARLSIEVIEADLLRERQEHQHLMAEKDRRIERLRKALEFYSRNGGASDTHDRKGCWILARRFCFVEAIAHDCEKLPYGETGTEYYMAGKLARAALQEDGK